MSEPKSIFGTRSIFGREAFGKGSRLPFRTSKLFPRDKSHQAECCEVACYKECDFVRVKSVICNCDGADAALCENPNVIVIKNLQDLCLYFTKSDDVPLPFFQQDIRLVDAETGLPLDDSDASFAIYLSGCDTGCLVPIIGRDVYNEPSVNTIILDITAGVNSRIILPNMCLTVIASKPGYQNAIVDAVIDGTNSMPDFLLTPIPAGKGIIGVSIFELFMYQHAINDPDFGSLTILSESMTIRFTNITTGEVSVVTGNRFVISPLYDLGDEVKFEILDPQWELWLNESDAVFVMNDELEEVTAFIYLGRQLCAPGRGIQFG